MQKLESELDNLTEESELIKHIEIKEKKNNIEFLKSRLAKLRIKDNKNAVLIDARENNIGHQQFPRGLQNRQSVRAVEVNTVIFEYDIYQIILTNKQKYTKYEIMISYFVIFWRFNHFFNKNDIPML